METDMDMSVNTHTSIFGSPSPPPSPSSANTAITNRPSSWGSSSQDSSSSRQGNVCCSSCLKPITNHGTGLSTCFHVFHPLCHLLFQDERADKTYAGCPICIKNGTISLPGAQYTLSFYGNDLEGLIKHVAEELDDCELHDEAELYGFTLQDDLKGCIVELKEIETTWPEDTEDQRRLKEAELRSTYDELLAAREALIHFDAEARRSFEVPEIPERPKVFGLKI